jgi:hypothetical protein
VASTVKDFLIALAILIEETEAQSCWMDHTAGGRGVGRGHKGL